MSSRSVFVLAKVVSIRDKFFYPCCTRCHKKVRTLGDDEAVFCCDGCREEYNPATVQYQYRISLKASDKTLLVQITVFGSCLDKFFGMSATNFARFLNNEQFDTLPIPWSHLVFQAVQQCFIGSSVQFGFRALSLYRTTSQIARNSPFHLKNIVKKQDVSVATRPQVQGLPSLLACQVLPCCLPDQQSPTVMEILNEYLQEFHRGTPQSLSVKSSQHSQMTDCSQSYEAKLAPRCTSLEEQRASPMYCTPQQVYSAVTPLILTGSSQTSSGSVLLEEKPLRSTCNNEKLVEPCLDLEDDQFASHNKDVCCENSNPPRGTQLATPLVRKSRQLYNRDFHGDILSHDSYQWTEFQEFSSSEDLSAFLVDLETDDVQDKNCPQTPVTPDGVTSHMMTSNSLTSNMRTSDSVTSNMMTFKEVVLHLSQTSVEEDFTEFTDFPSSENLDAFLADIELDCENMPVGMSVAPVATMENKCNYEAAASGTLIRNKGIVDTDPTEHAKDIPQLSNLCDSQGVICDVERSRDSFSVSEKFRRRSWSSLPDETVPDMASSDSQFLRDCERVLTKLSADICNGKDRINNADPRNRPHNLLQDDNSANNLFPKRTENLRDSGCEEKLLEKNTVVHLPPECEDKNIIRLRDGDCNEIGAQRECQSIYEGLVLRDHQAGNSDASNSLYQVLNYDFDISSSPALFSQSRLSPVEENCSKTLDLFSSPGFVNRESHNSCSKNMRETPELFSSPRDPQNHTQSCSKQDMNSLSLFSCSVHSPLSPSPPFALRLQQTSFPVRSESEADPLSIINNCQIGNQFDKKFRNDCFHSTPCSVRLHSGTLHKLWSPARVSPLLPDSRTASYCTGDTSFQGTPSLFSPMSSSNL